MSDYLLCSSKLPPYLAYPRFLLDVDINETAKLVYVVLLDRARLSQKNEGWTDKYGYVFLYFTISDLAVVLHKSEMTIKTALKVLTEKELIVRQRQGTGMPNRIYIKIPDLTDNFSAAGESENRPMDRRETVCRRDRKLSTNNKEISNNKEEKQESDTLQPFGRYQNVRLTHQELTALQSEFPDWSDRVERLSAYMASTGRKYKSHAATIRLWAEKDKSAPEKRSYVCGEDESL